MTSFSTRRVAIKELVSSRYQDGRRPESWDLREPGVDVVKTDEGEELKLQSDGQQSPPQPGWTILLTAKAEDGTFSWTLYGIAAPKAA